MIDLLLPVLLLAPSPPRVPATPPAAQAVAPTEAKAKRLADLFARLRAGNAPFFGQGTMAQVRAQLERLPANADLSVVLPLRLKLAQELLGQGEVAQAIAEVRKLEALAAQLRIPESALLNLRLIQGVLEFRRGELDNCVARHNEDSCLIPLSEKARHGLESGARASIAALVKLLEVKPDDLRAVWLLNLAHMAVGSWPDGVPAAWRIREEAFASGYELGRFLNVAPAAGLDTFALAGGAAVEDFDGDGLLDVFVTSSDPSEPFHLFRSSGDGTFEDRTEPAGLTGQTGSLHFVVGDYDNDGRLDVFALRGAWMERHGMLPCSLLRNMPDGTFRDVTREAGIEIDGPSQTAAFADIDNDGDLDLYVGYETWHDEQGPRATSRMWKNRGNGTFEDATASSGTENVAMCKGVAFGDVDGDRFADLYVSNLGRPNRLFRNKRDGTFEDVAEQAGVLWPIQSFATWFWDCDNDGDLDLWVANYADANRTESVCASYLNGTSGLDTCRLYENDGHGKFRDVTRERDMARPMYPMGCNFGDLDNDGWLDAYFGTGDPSFLSLWPNMMFRNDRGLRFQDVTRSGGFGVLQKGHSVAFADIDNDGDQDVFEQLGGALPSDGFWSMLFENPGHGAHWLTVRLRGAKTNRFGIGARVRVRIAEEAGERDVYGFVGANSSFGGNSLQQELGLGAAQRIVMLEVAWPVSGSTQRYEDVPLNCVVELTEGSGALERIELPRFRIGGGSAASADGSTSGRSAR